MADYRGKRLLDVIGATVGLVVGLPLIAVFAVLIKLETRGPALFRQVRVGRNERSFVLYKLRTMRVGTAQAGTHLISAHDVTRVGRALRKFKIDELPQLINVLRGEMSLVGPRPCLPSQTELVEARRQLGVFAVRPGITGRAQVNGVDMSRPGDLAAMDATYVAAMGLAGDIALLLATISGYGAGHDPVGRGTDTPSSTPTPVKNARVR